MKRNSIDRYEIYALSLIAFSTTGSNDQVLSLIPWKNFWQRFVLLFTRKT